MPTRFPSVAGMFYPADERSCRQEVTECLRSPESVDLPGPIWGGVVPHAGWAFSGPTAGRVFAALKAQEPPETIVLFGAVHSWGVSGSSMYGSGSWRTPLGELFIDEELAQAVLEASEGLVADKPQAHASEHSIEVQLPFIKHLFPDVRILPIAMPPIAAASDVGRGVARAVRSLGRSSVAVGSSDLTHYGPRYGFTPVGVGNRALEWTRQNDRRLLDLVVEMRAAEIVDEAKAHRNACGAGAIAASMAYAAELGATKGILLHYTTSHEVMPRGAPSDMVGYGAAIFV